MLISAPAGCGKTALLADWVTSRRSESRTAWVTLEARDEGVWPGLLGCLERLGVLPGSWSPPESGAAIDPALLADMASCVAEADRRVTVVVDGVEVVSSRLGDELDFLLRHSDDRLQLVLITRSDPVMPLYRYRLEETMVELRMTDLACDDDEAAAVLAASGVSLPPEPLHDLNARAQGWMVGLRFAAMHLATVEDPTAAVSDVVGNRGDIAEYLIREVLNAQTPEVRSLLLVTSVADVIRPGLTETLSGHPYIQTLALLTKENAFVEPVPEHPGFYRYHPFFRDLLRAELASESPALMDRLQHAAAAWFATHDMPTQSVRHLIAAADWSAAAGAVVERLMLADLVRPGGPGTLRDAFAAMPSGLPQTAPALVAATTMLAVGDLRRSTRELGRAREAIARSGAASTAETVTLAVLEALHARQSADPAWLETQCTVAVSAIASVVVPAEVATELLGLVQVGQAQALMRQGRTEDARAMLASNVRFATASRSDLVEMECLGHLALLACLRGDLAVAAALASCGLHSAERAGVGPTEQSATSYIALAWIDLEHEDPTSASSHAALADLSGFLSGDPISRSLLVVVSARFQARRGREAGARTLLHEALNAIGNADPWLTELVQGEIERLSDANTRVGSARSQPPPGPDPGHAVEPLRASSRPEPHAPPVVSALPADLIEALTPKEFEVLQHLAALLTTDEIAAAMSISVNTVRTHVRNILRKLGVTRRNAAVRRARELHLFLA